MDAPFDRGEVDRASLDATERLRARLSGRPIPAPRERPRSILPWVIAGSLFVFAAGLIANPWFERNVRSNLPFAESTPAQAPAGNRPQLQLPPVATPAPMPVERLARSEARIETSADQLAREAQRIDKLTADVAALSATIAADKASQASAVTTATAAADRAQAMLALVLVRRAIDSGRPLGALEPVLRQSFDARYPQAVQSVAALGAAPVTLASLRQDFTALRTGAGARAAAASRQGWWDVLATSVVDAVSRSPADSPKAPFEAAAAALARGDIATTQAQLRRLPAPRSADLTSWLAAADRLQAGNAALAALESATLLPPAAPAPAKAP